jgi:hypothetical protein
MFQVRPFSQIDPRWKDKKLGGGRATKRPLVTPAACSPA